MTVMTMTRPPAAAAQNNAAAACMARKNWKDGPRPRQESQRIKKLSILGNVLSGNRVIRNFKTSLLERQVTKLPNHNISQFPNFLRLLAPANAAGFCPRACIEHAR